MSFRITSNTSGGNKMLLRDRFMPISAELGDAAIGNVLVWDGINWTYGISPLTAQHNANTTGITETITFLQEWNTYEETGPSFLITSDTGANGPKNIITRGSTGTTSVYVPDGIYNARFQAQYSVNKGVCECADEFTNLIAALNANTFLTAGPAFSGIVTPGYYSQTAASTHNNTITYDAGGDPDAVFVFKIAGTLTFVGTPIAVLAGGAQSCNIFWYVVGAITLPGVSVNLLGNYCTPVAAVTDTAGGTTTIEGRFLVGNTSSAHAFQVGSLVGSVPTTSSVLYPTPSLQNHLIWNSFGPITCISGYTPAGIGGWDIETEVGVVSGFGPPYDGTFPASFPPLLYSVGIYNKGILVPVSLIYTGHSSVSEYNYMSTSSNIIATGGGLSEISVLLTIGTQWGGIVVGNRVLHLSPLYPT
jgi:hypothetical protein